MQEKLKFGNSLNDKGRSTIAGEFILYQSMRKISAAKTLSAMNIENPTATWIDVEIEILNFYERKETELKKLINERC